MSSRLWVWVALAGLCFLIGALLIRHIFEDSDAAEETPSKARYGILSAPALALIVIGAGCVGAWITTHDEIDAIVQGIAILGGAIAFLAVGLPALNILLARRQV